MERIEDNEVSSGKPYAADSTSSEINKEQLSNMTYNIIFKDSSLTKHLVNLTLSVWNSSQLSERVSQLDKILYFYELLYE